MSIENADYSREVELTGWQVRQRCGSGFLIETELDAEPGDYLLKYEIDTELPPVRIAQVTVNGEPYDFAHASGMAYGRPKHWGSRPQQDLPVHLVRRKNTVTAAGTDDRSDFLQRICFRLAPVYFTPVPPVPAFSRRFRIPEKTYPAALPGQPDQTGFRPGIGTEIIPGRFGFQKGDGVLDCAMPVLGEVDKMYLCGHPKYCKPFRWHYSTLPEGASRHGSPQCPVANCGIGQDRITVNHLSVRWETEFNNIPFACTYSLASPGIITESGNGEMRLSALEYAGNYQYILIPRPGGELEIASLRNVRDFTMGENFLLLFGTSEFPDVPLLLVFEKQPENVEVRYYADGRLSEIRFRNAPLLITATPFGLETFDPIAPQDAAFAERAAERCRFWSRALMAYPVRCQEFYRNDPEKRRTEITQRFSYRTIRDAWHTPPLELAPLPPMTSLCGMLETADAQDFHFPTKFGILQGAYGTVSRYSLPWMPAERRFPLADRSMPELKTLLMQGFDAYLKMVSMFDRSTQAYPYSGALLEPFAYAAPLFYFLPEQERELVRRELAARLRLVCRKDRTYDYPAIDWCAMMREMPESPERLAEIYHDQAMKHWTMHNWYERTEPFTGQKYHVCYLNACLFMPGGGLEKSDPETVNHFPNALIENDWGVGVTFYYIYLAALAAGDFSAVRENWDRLNSVFSYFEKLHDWACLGTGFSDNGILWCEGGNYGAFTSFILMAEAVGDHDAGERAQYLAAKQFALRMGVLRSAQHYFCRYFGVKPWYITKHIREEHWPSGQYLRVPELDENRFSYDGVYNLTTEGIFPEFFAGLREKQPEDARILADLLEKSVRNMPENAAHDWTRTQAACSLLTYMALDPEQDTRKLKEMIALVRSKQLMMDAWRGIHIFSRRLPERYFETMLLAWDAMKSHPVWLEYWEDVQIETAEWDAGTAVIVFRTGNAPKIRFGIRRRPGSILLDQQSVPAEFHDNVMELRPPHAGTLRIRFDSASHGG